MKITKHRFGKRYTSKEIFDGKISTSVGFWNLVGLSINTSVKSDIRHEININHKEVLEIYQQLQDILFDAELLDDKNSLK